MNCFRTSNNKHFNAPQRMSDGRNFTDYRPNYELNQTLKEKNKLDNSHNYRNFLNNNAEKIIEENRVFSASKNALYKCKEPYHIGTMVPEKTKIICNAHSCNRVLNDKNGFGEGRTYNTTDKPNTILEPLKQPEMTNLDPNLCASLSDNFEYYPINTNRTDKEFLDNKILPNGSKIMTGGDPNPSIVN